MSAVRTAHRSRPTRAGLQAVPAHATVRVTVCGLATLGLAACGSPAPACHLRGAPTGVAVDLGGIGFGREQTWQVHACVATVCRTTVLAPPDPPRVFVPDSGVSGRAVVVTLDVRLDSGEVVFAGHATVTPARVHPNGRGCPPTGWQAGVRALPGGRLEPAGAATPGGSWRLRFQAIHRVQGLHRDTSGSAPPVPAHGQAPNDAAGFA